MKSKQRKQLIEQGFLYPQVTDAANRRFDEALMELPPISAEERAPADKVRVHRGRPWRISLSAAAAVLVFLFTLNLTVPAVAENIPGLGEIFKTLNYKRAMGSNSPGYPDLVQPVGVSAGTDKCRVTVREAYSEGRYVFVSLGLTSDDPAVNEAEWLSTTYFYDSAAEDGRVHEARAAINGQTAELFRTVSFGKIEGGYEAAAIVKLPADAQNGDVIKVQLEIDALRGLKEGTERRLETAPEINVEEPILLAFDVTVNTDYNTGAQPGTQKDGVTLVSYESTPSYFNVTLGYPALGTVLSTEGDMGWVEARTEDGTVLERNSGNTDFWVQEGIHPGDAVSQLTAFDGVPLGTKKVIVTLSNMSLDSYGVDVGGNAAGACVFGEFTVDLETGTAVPTETYLEKGLKSRSIVEYAAEFAAGPQFQNHMFVKETGMWFGKWKVVTDEDEVKDPNGENESVLLTFYADTTEELPWEAVFYIGDRTITVPLARQADSGEQSYGYVTLREEAGVQVMEREKAEALEKAAGREDSGVPKQIKKAFNVIFYLPELNGKSPAEAAEYEMHWQLRNTETEQVLFDSNDVVSPY